MAALCCDMLVLPALAASLVLVAKEVWAQKELELELVGALPLLLWVLRRASLVVEQPF